MDTDSFNLNERVRLPDRREGLVKAIYFSPDAVTVAVLTDDYVEVECWPWQATKIRRARGQTVKSKDPEGSFYPVELENNARLRMAVWHDHWDRFPPTPGSTPGFYAGYWDQYSSGNKAPLPAREDIRNQAPAPPRKPEELRLF